MIVASLSDCDLHCSTLLASQKEKAATLDLLIHLAEIERRKLFVEYGCSSLHKYTVTQLKYSPAEAWTRISAMRLIRDSASALQSLSQGKLTLSNASLLQENKKNIPDQNFDHILKMAEEKSFRELEKILNDIKSPSPPRPKKIELSVALLEKMKRLQKIYGEDLSEIELIEALLDKELKQQATEVKKSSPATDKTKSTRYIPKSTRAFILKKANFQCQAISPEGARCPERRHLQFEHIHPFAKGGHRDTSNLELLCPGHNARRKFQNFGEAQKSYPLFFSSALKIVTKAGH